MSKIIIFVFLLFLFGCKRYEDDFYNDIDYVSTFKFFQGGNITQTIYEMKEEFVNITNLNSKVEKILVHVPFKYVYQYDGCSYVSVSVRFVFVVAF